MYNNEFDIAQIIKYHSGELDAKAMHQIEKRALDDPFLMDALEGLADNNNQTQTISEIKELLAKRVNKPQRKIIPWKFLTIAASLVVFVSITLMLILTRKNTGQFKVAQNLKPDAIKTEKPVAPVIPYARPAENKTVVKHTPKAVNELVKTKKSQNVTDGNYIAASPVAAEDKTAVVNVPLAKQEAVKDSTPLNEMIVMNYSAQKKPEPAPARTKAQNEELKKAPATAHEQLLPAEAEGVTKTSSPEPVYNSNAIDLKKMVIKGRVVGGDDGLPVAGAIVKVAGSNDGTITGSDGSFALHTRAEKNKVLVAYTGYQTKELNLNKGDSAKVIALDPNNNSLSEVVVTGYNNVGPASKADSIYQPAHPKNGWGEFKKYLKSNKVSPDGKTGTVKVSFEVSYNGNITMLKVTQSLSEATDKKALELIQNGPQWSGNTSGKPETVNVKIKFEQVP